MGRGKLTLSLEDYQRFLHNPNDVDLSISQLNQIIFMHGFKKIHKQRKNVVFECLKEIKLTKPHRSTLEENVDVSDDPLVSLEEVKDDVEALKWQECKVQSIVTVGLRKKPKDMSFSVRRRRRSKRKKGGSVWMAWNRDITTEFFHHRREK